MGGCTVDILWSIIGSILRPFLVSSPCRDVAKPGGKPMSPLIGIPGTLRRLGKLTKSMPISPSFIKSGPMPAGSSGALGISLRGLLPLRRVLVSRFTGSVRIRVNFPSGRKPLNIYIKKNTKKTTVSLHDLHSINKMHTQINPAGTGHEINVLLSKHCMLSFSISLSLLPSLPLSGVLDKHLHGSINVRRRGYLL